jgi:hypothetical protein
MVLLDAAAATAVADAAGQEQDYKDDENDGEHACMYPVRAAVTPPGMGSLKRP